MSLSSFILFFLLVVSVPLYGQQIIRGRVLDEYLEILPGADVYGNDTIKLGVTNIDGYFEISVPKEINKLTFGFIGFERTSISSYCNYIEIILQCAILYHYKSNSKIDKLRKRRFDKLIELHEKAFLNNLFIEKTPCFQYEFIAIKPQLDEIGLQMKAKRRDNKEYFKELEIGDTIKIPYDGTFRYDGTDRSTLSVFSYVVDDSDFDCIIEGVIQSKNRKNNGQVLSYKVTSLNKCNYGTLVYENKEVTKGSILDHDMKYSKILK